MLCWNIADWLVQFSRVTFNSNDRGLFQKICLWHQLVRKGITNFQKSQKGKILMLMETKPSKLPLSEKNFDKQIHSFLTYIKQFRAKLDQSRGQVKGRSFKRDNSQLKMTQIRWNYDRKWCLIIRLIKSLLLNMACTCSPKTRPWF